MKLRSLLLGLVLAVAVTLVLPPSTARAEENATFDVAGFTFTRPADWTWIAVNSPMRKAQLRVGGAEPAAGGDVTFFHFTGGGADVETNTKRWLGQFKSKEGADKVETKTLNGVKVTFVTTEGTFSSGMPGGPTTPMNDFALIGAIMEATEGSVFVKFVGPEKVVKGAHDKFVQFITDATKTRK
jgi:hypothetical protein